MSIQIIASELFSLISSRGFLIVAGSIASLVLVVWVFFKVEWFFKKRSYPANTVILHQFPSGYRIPSASPYALKLETWLRMADIKYKNEFGFRFGPKGKIPFITYNGVDVPDSQFCIEYLSKVFDIDFSKKHSPKDLGIARAFFKMSEESLFWVSGLFRMVYQADPKYMGVHPILMWYVKRVYRKRGYIQGYGRHSVDELFSIGKADLKALDLFLDGKRFLLGDDPCNEDAAVFGILAQFIYTDCGMCYKFIKDECPNIVRYVDTIKNTYWKDWDDRITINKNKKNQ